MNTNYLSKTFNFLFLPVLLLVSYCNYLIFLVVPNEKLMGPVQRVFYFHVASATACYVAIGVLLIASLAYLANKTYEADVIAEASAEVAFVLCTITLISGMIWGHSAWNTWFSWEPRLVSFLVLWLILLAYNLLRRFADKNNVASHAAVLGIISAVNVPIVVYSIKLLPSLAQLHPQVIENRGLKDPLFQSTLFKSMAAMLLLEFLLIALRTRIGLLETKSRES